MDNNSWKDFIYLILIAVVYIVRNVLSQRKKHTAKKKVVSTPRPEIQHEPVMQEQSMHKEATPPEEKSKAETIFTSIFDALLDEETFSEQNKKKQEPIVEEPTATDNVESVEKKKEYESILDKKESGIILHEETEEQESDFDLREAVVYSEILNRKYSY